MLRHVQKQSCLPLVTAGEETSNNVTLLSLIYKVGQVGNVHGISFLPSKVLKLLGQVFSEDAIVQ